MGKGRVEAFSDGVIAIIITIMVLEFKTPDEPDLAGLIHFAPHLAIYALSFVYVGIYWSNHHHLLQAARSVTGSILWANLHLLFWLSLVPFGSGWMAESKFASLPVAFYGAVLLMTGVAYLILARRLVAHEGEGSVIARAIGRDTKTILSLCGYIAAIILAPFQPVISVALYGCVALAWLIPDPRIERAVKSP